MSEPTVFDQLFGQELIASNDVASQLFGNLSTTSVEDQLFGSSVSVASQLFDNSDNADSNEDFDFNESEEAESNESDFENENETDEQESVTSQLFGQTVSSSVEEQLFGKTTSNEQNVEDQLFGVSVGSVEGDSLSQSPELVIARLSSLLTPNPVSGSLGVNITFHGPVTFNL